MFSKWKYRLIIKNTLDRQLKLTGLSIPYGTRENISDVINAGETGECTVYSSAGKPTGIEFYATYSDEAQPTYGSFTVNVDMPYWKTKNSSSINTTGIISIDGFMPVPNGNRDFQNSIIVTTKL